MGWDFETDRPIYIQIMEKIQLLILAGVYPVGAKLPSVRDLAQQAAVNPNTMQRALAQLEEEGLVITQRTSGRFVTENEEKIIQARRRLARDQVTQLLVKMRELGLGKEQILEIINEIAEEMKI
ncbi:MAG: GntR family transcriptional regulator [Firmicutes bacterium]|nr:GntR family transcriptional regulator [Bacillota bacterium]